MQRFPPLRSRVSARESWLVTRSSFASSPCSGPFRLSRERQASELLSQFLASPVPPNVFVCFPARCGGVRLLLSRLSMRFVPKISNLRNAQRSHEESTPESDFVSLPTPYSKAAGRKFELGQVIKNPGMSTTFGQGSLKGTFCNHLKHVFST